MTNRVFLAIFLSLLVLIIYPQIISKLYPQYTNGIKRYHDTVSTQKEKITQHIEKKYEIKSDTVREPTKTIRLSTSNYKIELTGQNGSITKIFLNKFHNVDSKQPLELISTDLNNGLFRLYNLEEGQYDVKDVNSDSVSLGFVRSDGIEVTKIISVLSDSYAINLDIVFKNLGPNPMTLNYGLAGVSGLFQDKGQDARFFEVVNSVDGKPKKENARLLMQRESNISGVVTYVLQRNKYFSLILKPTNSTVSERYQTVSNGIKRYQNGIKTVSNGIKTVSNGIKRYQTVSVSSQYLGGERFISTLFSGDFTIPRNEEVVHAFTLFAGPNDYDAMKALNNGFEETLTYGLLSGIGQVLLMLLRVFNKIIHNYGVSIILLTILIGTILLPLTMKNVKAMKAMQKLQPQIARLKEEYKDNPQKLNKEIMQLYAQRKVNPLGGCLPMALQMPVFIALYQALVRSLELRGAKFLWIKDLSRPDSAFILPSAIPFLGNSINLLPILMIFAMILQQKSGQVDKNTQTQEQKMMASFMPLLFGLLFYNLPSGLVLYWLTNTLFMLFIQKALLRREG